MISLLPVEAFVFIALSFRTWAHHMANPKELTPAQRRNLAELTSGFRGIVLFLFLISGLINVLALTGSLYMMQIYDRALTSGSIPTLLLLSALAIGLYLFQGTFDVIRSQVLVRVGARAGQEGRAAGASGGDRHAAFRLLDVRGAGTRPRRRYGARLPRQPGAGGVVRPAMDADLSRLRLFSASAARRVDVRRRVRAYRADGAQRDPDQASAAFPRERRRSRATPLPTPMRAMPTSSRPWDLRPCRGALHRRQQRAS